MVLNLWVITPLWSVYQILILRFLTAAKLELWSNNEIISWLWSPEHEELYWKLAELGRLRSTALVHLNKPVADLYLLQHMPPQKPQHFERSQEVICFFEAFSSDSVSWITLHRDDRPHLSIKHGKVPSVKAKLLFWSCFESACYPLSLLFMYLFGSTKGQSQGLVNARQVHWAIPSIPNPFMDFRCRHSVQHGMSAEA